MKFLRLQIAPVCHFVLQLIPYEWRMRLPVFFYTLTKYFKKYFFQQGEAMRTASKCEEAILMP